MKAYFFCTFLGYDLYFFPQFFVLFLGNEPVATLRLFNGLFLLKIMIFDQVLSKFHKNRYKYYFEKKVFN